MTRQYIVTLMHNGEKWPLKRTTWAYSMDRAQKFSSVEEAQAQLDKAKKFMKAATYKAAQIEELPA